jgi:hypothetical protein
VNAKAIFEHKYYLYQKIDTMAEIISSKAEAVNGTIGIRLLRSICNDKYCSTREYIIDQIPSGNLINALQLDEFEIILSNITSESFFKIFPDIYDLIINVRSFHQTAADFSHTIT